MGGLMSQRDSGYERKERDLYETPAWATLAVCPHLPKRLHKIWEPAAGGGKMVEALKQSGLSVVGSDIANGGSDFLTVKTVANTGGIVTNPPYVLAQEFISHALELMQPSAGFVAMLLRTDFDHAKTRQFLFSYCPPFAKKLVLTKRIQWFEDSKGSPSFNHAWFIWDWQNKGAPTLAYGP
jgi:hypothetical protein